MNTIKKLPYKINVSHTVDKLRSCKTEEQKIKLIMNMMAYYNGKIIAVSDLIQIVKSEKISEDEWMLYVGSLQNEDAVFLYAKTVTFVRICGMLTITPFLEKLINKRLECIYKNQIS